MLPNNLPLEETFKALKITKTQNTLMIPLLWKYLIADTYLKEHYILDLERSFTCVSNQYGTYSQPPYLIDPESDDGKRLNEYILKKTSELMWKMPKLSPSAYKVVISALNKIYAHLIPEDEETLNKLLVELNTLDPVPFIDSYYPIEDSFERRLQTVFIYGIYYQEQLIYIGKTTRPIKNRVSEHLTNFKNKTQKDYLYYCIPNLDWTQLKFKVLFSTSQGIMANDLAQIERALIMTNKPIGNKEFKNDMPVEVLGPEDEMIQEMEACVTKLEQLITNYRNIY